MKLIYNFLIAIAISFFALSAEAVDDKHVLFVLTSNDKMGDSGQKTGFWLPELTHPYYELKDAGVNIDIASIKGGISPIDEKSFDPKDEENNRFLKDAELMSKVLRTKKLEDLKAADYDAIVYVGGSGTMWDFPNNKDVNRITKNMYESGKIVAALCHGPAALIDVKLSNGRHLIEGKRIAAFNNQEEADIEGTDVVPFLLEDKLKERGAHYVDAPAWTKNVVVDGRLITGQNPTSAKGVGEEILKQLK